ncbi:hypothetical protein GCM10023153_08640 [Ornithinibacter aureus]|uniref:Uncharacterized protein n=1 Tax=Ornithinibacter aureus TaxID=622664 RepID=A0ABP8JHU9_9MICO
MSFRSAVIADQCFLEAYRRLLRTRCTTHVCTSASGQVARIASGRPLEAVAADDAHVEDATVSQIGEHVHRLLRALPTGGADPHPQHVPLTLEGDAHGHVHRPVPDVAVTDLEHDRIDQHHRAHRVQRA